MRQFIKIIVVFQCFMILVSPAQAAPDLMNIEAGMAQINTQNRTTIIDQTTDRAILNWNHFDIGSDEIVQFRQPSAQSFTLNRVPQNFAPTNIFGTLNANGNIAIINPRGIIFGNTAQINTGGFIASTKDILSGDVMDSNTKMTLGSGQNYAGIIRMDGDLRTGKNGKIMLNADEVNINGTITGNRGMIAITTADQVIFDLSNGQNQLDLILSAGDININNSSINSRHGEINIIAGNDISIEDSILNSGEKNLVIEGVHHTRIRQSNFKSTGGEIRLTSDSGDGFIELNDTILASKGKNNFGTIDINTEAVGQNDLGSAERFRRQNFVVESDKGGNIRIATGRIVGGNNCVVVGSTTACGASFQDGEFEVDHDRVIAEQIYIKNVNKARKQGINDTKRAGKIIINAGDNSQTSDQNIEINLSDED